MNILQSNIIADLVIFHREGCLDVLYFAFQSDFGKYFTKSRRFFPEAFRGVVRDKLEIAGAIRE